MNTVPTITPGSITGMTGLTKRPVFFVRLNGSANPNLVVKGENAGADLPHATDVEATTSVKWGSKLMKNVNNTSVNTKVMTPNEVIVFRQAAVASFPNGSEQHRFVAGGQAYNWVKMPFVAGLSDAEFYNDDNSVSQAAIKRSIGKLSDDQVWTDLGKIVAVDIFNGNNDRFDTNDGRWVNKGNIMFLAAGPTKVIGLDTFDPNSEQANLVRQQGGFDDLRKLIDPGQRRNYAIACAKSVGNEFKRALGNTVAVITLMTNCPHGPQQLRVEVGQLQDLFLPYAPNFEAGLTQGATDLKNYLQSKVRQYGNQWNRARPTGMAPRIGGARAAAHAPARKTIPQAILDRMAYLGWMP